ncbi:MAG: TatD family deoxyribonuclease [Burkholderiaceae bacterium]|nr:TatD family deoxyribonuclease [Burkholderiaceae bacterium]
MLIDSHCHLDYLDVPANPGGIMGAISRARSVGVRAVIVPTVAPENFDRVVALAESIPEVFFALGIHPIYVQEMSDSSLDDLQNALRRFKDHPKLVAVGEIGLDHYVSDRDREKMQMFYLAQCKMARDFSLPVVLHVRKAQDQVLKGLRRYGIRSGIAHAFNGSLVQAQAYIAQGLVLGFGGAMTFTRAAQIRRLAATLPLSAIVLETDSPDIAPAWRARGAINEPGEMLAIARCLAELRDDSLETIIRATGENSLRVLPRLNTHA